MQKGKLHHTQQPTPADKSQQNEPKQLQSLRIGARIFGKLEYLC